MEIAKTMGLLRQITYDLDIKASYAASSFQKPTTGEGKGYD